MELSYISRNKNPKNFHIFEDVAFQAQKKQQQQKTKKKNTLKKTSYILGNGTF